MRRERGRINAENAESAEGAEKNRKKRKKIWDVGSQESTPKFGCWEA
jgi:hypothetical protein